MYCNTLNAQPEKSPTWGGSLMEIRPQVWLEIDSWLKITLGYMGNCVGNNLCGCQQNDSLCCGDFSFSSCISSSTLSCCTSACRRQFFLAICA